MQCARLLFNFMIVCFFLPFTSCKEEAPDAEITGKYVATSEDPQARAFLAGENNFIEIRNDKTILYNTTINQKPKFYFEGTFSFDDVSRVLSIKWEKGKLPNQLKVEDDGRFYVIRIGNTAFIKSK